MRKFYLRGRDLNVCLGTKEVRYWLYEMGYAKVVEETRQREQTMELDKNGLKKLVEFYKMCDEDHKRGVHVFGGDNSNIPYLELAEIVEQVIKKARDSELFEIYYVLGG